jgi:outer membrane protein
MNTLVKSLFALAAFGATALFVQAQPAPKILVVDMAKLYDGHYKTEEQNGKLKEDEGKAQVELDKLNKDGNTLVEDYKQMVEQSKNPALTADARTKAEGDAQKKYEDIQKKQNEVQTFKVNTQRSLQQRVNTFKQLLLEEISKLTTDIAKKKGATIVIDKAGPSMIGVSNIVYTDPSYDITDEVMAEINKTRPAGMPAAPAAPGANSLKPSSTDAPSIAFPGAKK